MMVLLAQSVLAYYNILCNLLFGASMLFSTLHISGLSYNIITIQLRDNASIG